MLRVLLLLVYKACYSFKNLPAFQLFIQNQINFIIKWLFVFFGREQDNER